MERPAGPQPGTTKVVTLLACALLVAWKLVRRLFAVERILFGCALFICVCVAVDLAGVAPLGWGATLAGVAAAGVVAPAITRSRRADRGAPAAAVVGAACAAAVLGVLEWTTRHTFALPGDAIAVPAFARAVFMHGTALRASFAPDSLFVAYPPGYPVLFAPAFALVSPLTALGVFKHLALAVVAVTPLLWARLLHRMFALPISQSWTIVATYVASIGIERTLLLGVLLSGKSALFMSALLAPVAVGLLLAEPRSWSDDLLSIVALAATMMVHYSVLCLIACLALSYLLVVHPPWRHGAAAKWVRTLGLVLASVALVLPAVLPRTTTSDHPAAAAFTPLPALTYLWAALTTARDPLLFLFHDLPTVRPSPWRGPLLVACAMVPGLLALTCRRDDLDRLSRMGLTFLVAVAFALVLASGSVPALRIHPDYVRWFLFYLEVPVILVPLLALLALRPVLPGPAGRTTIAALLLAVAALAIASVGNDLRVDAAVLAPFGTSHGRLRETAKGLRDIEALGPCYLIAEAAPHGLQTVLEYPPLTFTPALSSCRVVTGTWLSHPLFQRDDTHQLPDRAALAALPPDAVLTWIGSHRGLEAWLRQVPGLTAARLPIRMSRLVVARLRLGAEDDQGSRLMAK